MHIYIIYIYIYIVCVCVCVCMYVCMYVCLYLYSIYQPIVKNAKEKNSKKHIFTTSFPCKRNKVGLRMYSSMRTHVCAVTQNAGYPGNCGIKKLRLNFLVKPVKYTVK